MKLSDRDALLDTLAGRLNQHLSHFPGVTAFSAKPYVVEGKPAYILCAAMSERLSNGTNLNPARLGLIDEANRKRQEAFNKLCSIYRDSAGDNDELMMVQRRDDDVGSMALAFTGFVTGVEHFSQFVDAVEETLSRPEARVTRNGSQISRG